MFQIHILQLSFHLTDSKGIKKSDSMFTIALNIKLKWPYRPVYPINIPGKEAMHPGNLHGWGI